MIGSDFALIALLYSSIFLGSIYIFGGIKRRQESLNIKFRILGATFGSLLVVCHILELSNCKSWQEVCQRFENFKWSRIFITCRGLLSSILYGILSTEILYFGQWFHMIFYERSINMRTCRQFISYLFTLRGFRNIIAAPFHEEFVFRAALIYQAQKYFNSSTDICLVNGIIFAFAHLHHLFEDYLDHVPLKNALLGSIIQMGYTFIFGYYSSYVLLMTGNLASSIAIHSLCNLHGLPEIISAVKSHSRSKRRYLNTTVTIGAYVLGLLGWLNILKGY